MRSMTGYGRAVSPEIQGLRWIVELHGVNRKMLDVNVFLPREMLHLDIDVRQRLSPLIERGQVTVRVTLKQPALEWQSSEAYLTSLKGIKKNWIALAAELGYDKEAINLPFLLGRLDQIALDELPIDQNELQDLLMATLDEAVAGFVQMKETEGQRLAQDLHQRLKAIRESVAKIEKEGAGAPNKFYQKLKARIEEHLAGAQEDEERIWREVALYAEKADITEEITRLGSHFKQAFALLEKDEKSVGRVLEFLVQEMQREVNTISAKSGGLEITNLALFAKAELEKIREQVQNIE